MKQVPPGGGRRSARPRSTTRNAYKDAAVAMLTYEKRPVLVADDAARKQLTDALIDWSQHDFDHRLVNSAQMFGHGADDGAPSAHRPSSRSPASSRSTRAATIASRLSSPSSAISKTKEANRVEARRSRQVHGGRRTWIDKKQARGRRGQQSLEDHRKPRNRSSSSSCNTRDEALTKVFAAIKKVGTRPAVDYCLSIARRQGADREASSGPALAALEGRVDRKRPGRRREGPHAGGRRRHPRQRP